MPVYVSVFICLYVFFKASADPLVKNQPAGLQVLQLWREKVFKLCVQLRTKDIELREEKDKLLSNVCHVVLRPLMMFSVCALKCV